MECDYEPGSEGVGPMDACSPLRRCDEGDSATAAAQPLPLRDSTNWRAAASPSTPRSCSQSMRAGAPSSHSDIMSQCDSQSSGASQPQCSSDEENDPDCVMLDAPPPPRSRLVKGPPRRLVDTPPRPITDAAAAAPVPFVAPAQRSYSMPSHQADACVAAAAPVARSSSVAAPIPPPQAAAQKKGSAAAFNALVRAAKAHEERESWSDALECYEEMQTLRPELESVQKKIRILRKRIAALMEDRQENKEVAEAAVVAAPAAKALAEPAAVRMLPLHLDGKFAYDSCEDVFLVVLSPADAFARATAASASASSSSAPSLEALESHLSSALSAQELPSSSPLLSRPPFRLPAPLWHHTYPHQREGLHWLYSQLHLKGTGGILGDDMGLGKTIQVCAYVASLFFNRLAKRVLVVVPVSVLAMWQRELEKWAGARCELDAGGIEAGAGGGAKPSGGDAEAGVYKSGLALRMVTVYSGTRTPRQRREAETALRKLMDAPEGGGVVLATYGSFAGKNPRLLCGFADPRRRWDYAFLDEGHKIKNPDTQLASHLRALPVGHRVLLTGTPVTNNLDELWALMDWATDRGILGCRRNFRADFSTRIMAGLAKGASAAEQELGARLTERLKEIIRPHLLRREKTQVQQANQTSAAVAAAGDDVGDAGDDDDAAEDEEDEKENAADDNDSSLVPRVPRPLPRSAVPVPVLPQLTAQKNDWIIWLQLTPLQDKLYRLFLGDSSVRQVFSAGRSRGPLPALTALKKLCDHPRMLEQGMEYMDALRQDLKDLPPLPGVHVRAAVMPSAAAAAASSEDDGGASARASSARKNKEFFAALASLAAAKSPESRSQLSQAVGLLCAESYKFACLRSLLSSHVAGGHRTLIFSQSRRMLSFVSLLLSSMGMGSLSIDGGVTDPLERQRRVDAFNAHPRRYQAFLLTTRAGGVGICLTGANRVVILDPDWCPALDNQAVDRCFRLGQKRNVVVYRFITCGTVEEVVYRKQVFKGSVIRAATGTASATGAGAGAGQGGRNNDHAAGSAAGAGAGPGGAGSGAGAAEDPSSSSSSGTTRYFNKEELREVFHYKTSSMSSTFDSLRLLHPPSQRLSYPELEDHAREVERLEGVHGITDHDRMFMETAPQPVQPAEVHQQDSMAQGKDGAGAAAAAAAAAGTGEWHLAEPELDPQMQAALDADAAEERRAQVDLLVAQAASRAQANGGERPRSPHRPDPFPKPKQRAPSRPREHVETIDISSSDEEHGGAGESDSEDEEDGGWQPPREDQSQNPPAGFGPPASAFASLSESDSECDSEADANTDADAESGSDSDAESDAGETGCGGQQERARDSLLPSLPAQAPAPAQARQVIDLVDSSDDDADAGADVECSGGGEDGAQDCDSSRSSESDADAGADFDAPMSPADVAVDADGEQRQRGEEKAEEEQLMVDELVSSADHMSISSGGSGSAPHEDVQEAEVAVAADAVELGCGELDDAVLPSEHLSPMGAPASADCCDESMASEGEQPADAEVAGPESSSPGPCDEAQVPEPQLQMDLDEEALAPWSPPPVAAAASPAPGLFSPSPASVAIGTPLAANAAPPAAQLPFSPPPAVVLQLSDSDSDSDADAADADSGAESLSDSDSDAADGDADSDDGDASFHDAREWRGEGVEENKKDEEGSGAGSPHTQAHVESQHIPLASPSRPAQVAPAPQPMSHACPPFQLSAEQIRAYNTHLSQAALLQRSSASEPNHATLALQQLQHLLHAASLCSGAGASGTDPLLRQRIMRLVAQTGLEACLPDGEPDHEPALEIAASADATAEQRC